VVSLHQELAAFNRQLDQYIGRDVEREAQKLHRIVSIEALKRVVLKSPTDTGRFRGGWQLTVGQPSTSSPLRTDRAGGATISAGISALSALRPYSVVWIVNNTIYGEVLELGGFVPKDPGPSKDPRPTRKGKVLVRGGYSVQAPQGMVRVTVQELRGIFS
jgi:hypothetical protein